MKKFQFTILLSIIGWSLFAQNVKYNIQDAGQSKEGYVVKSNYDTLKGYIQVSEPHFMEYSIDFQKGSNSGNTIFRPNDLISYATKDPIGREILWVSTHFSTLQPPPQKSYMGTENQEAFINAVVTGPISIYTYYNFQEGAEPARSTTQYMQLPDKTIVDISGLLLGFSKKMPDYVSDYKELATKISKKQKGYKVGSINDIAREFNAWYLKNNPGYKFITAEFSKKPTTSLAESMVFNSDPITFPEYPGIKFWLSDPYQSYNQWDTQKTGDSWLSVALKMKNNSGKSIAKLTPKVTAYNKDGSVLKESTGGFSPFAFEPNPGDAFPDGYEGVMNSFFRTDLSNVDNFGKVNFSIVDFDFASSKATNQPSFGENWMTFDGYDGLQFRLSEPFIFVDDLSGNNRFGVALEINNESGKEIDKFYMQIKVYDDQGILFDEERQNHQEMYEPGIMKMNPTFPIGYQGINKKFYTNEEGFIDKFKKIEIVLNRVEYKE